MRMIFEGYISNNGRLKIPKKQMVFYGLKDGQFVRVTIETVSNPSGIY